METNRVAEALQEKAEDIKIELEDAKRRLSSLGDTAVKYIKENPGRCVVGAIALGYLIGRIARR